MYRKFVLSFLFLVAVLAAVIPASSASVSAPPWMSRNGTIGALLKLGDGSQADLDAVVIGKIRANQAHPYIVVHEMFSPRDKIVVMVTPSPQLRLGQTVDIKGLLSTLPNNQRAIINASVLGYCDKMGKLLIHGPLIKGLLKPTEWPNMTNLTIESKSTATSIEATSSEPNVMPLPAPKKYNTIHDLLTRVTLMADGDFIEMIGFVCKPIDSIGSGYFMLGEDDSQDQLKVYYTGTVSTSQRICRIVGQLREENNGQVLCIDSGPGYTPQDGEGSLTLANAGTIGWAKTLPDSSSVTLGTAGIGKIVTCSMSSSCLYIEEDDRSSGIRVEKSGHGRLARDRAYVVGTMATTASGERYINATTADHAGDGLLKPLGMNNRWIGGGDFFYEASSGKGQRGITEAFGINTIGLLVRTWGKVTTKDAATPCTWFTIDDGSGVGVKVDLVTSTGNVIAASVSTNDYVYVTGISSFETSGSDLLRVVRPGPIVQPTFDPPAGDYCGCQGVTAKSAMLGDTIRYTTNGNSPDSSSTVCDPLGFIIVNLYQTLKARVYRDAWVTAGSVGSAYYSLDDDCNPTPTAYTCYQNHTVYNHTVSNMRITSLSAQPEAVGIGWQGHIYDTFEAKRKLASDSTNWNDVSIPFIANGTSADEIVDIFDYAIGNTYLYAVRVESGIEPEPSLPECTQACRDYYDDSTPERIHHPYYRSVWPTSDWAVTSMTPATLAVSENQAVDSREDTRYIESVPVNFQFGSRVRRGGLFVGNAGDPSKVGRSFLKFDMSTALNQMGTNDRLWTGGLEVYYTRSFAEGMSTDIGCQFVPNDNWSAATVAWNTAPVIDASKAIEHKPVGGTTPGWFGCWTGIFPEIAQETYGDHTLSLALASMTETDEQNPGWAYFAKKEYDPNLASRILYAYGKYENGGTGVPPVFATKLELNTSEVTGGNTVVGMVKLNCPAPTGGHNVNLTVVENACYVRLTPYTVHVPEGKMKADFIVSTAIVSSAVEVQITTFDASTTLTINP